MNALLNLSQLRHSLSLLLTCMALSGALLACDEPSPKVENEVKDRNIEALLYVSERSLWIAEPEAEPRVLIDEHPLHLVLGVTRGNEHIMVHNINPEMRVKAELLIYHEGGEPLQVITDFGTDCQFDLPLKIEWEELSQRFYVTIESLGCGPSPSYAPYMWVDPYSGEVTRPLLDEALPPTLAEVTLNSGIGRAFLRRVEFDDGLYEWGVVLNETGEAVVSGRDELGRYAQFIVGREEGLFYVMSGDLECTLWQVNAVSGEYESLREYIACDSLKLWADLGDQVVALFHHSLMSVPLDGSELKTLQTLDWDLDDYVLLTPDLRNLLHISDAEIHSIDVTTGSMELLVAELNRGTWPLKQGECKRIYGDPVLSPASDRFVLTTVEGRLSDGCPNVEDFVPDVDELKTYIFDARSLAFKGLNENRGFVPSFSPSGKQLAWFKPSEEEGCYLIQTRDFSSGEDFELDDAHCIQQPPHWINLD